MTIISWNCNMAFRKKAAFILKYQPDIIVVPECEQPDKLHFTAGTPLPNDIIWNGSNPHKGLGVFSYSKYKFKLLECHNPAFKNILPIQVTGGKIDFILFAVWANNPEDKDGVYITQVWKALHHYESLFKGKKIILAGDFNSNTIWDKPRREGNHSTVVKKLESKKIFSTYHIFHNQEQGAEADPTLFMYRHKNKPYHLDYCFASSYFIKKLSTVVIGKHKDWKHLSDHTPLLVSFDI